MNFESPIITIGCGRSGSTLLGRVLGYHPNIDYKGETNFLLPRLWLELWEDHFWLDYAMVQKLKPDHEISFSEATSEAEQSVQMQRMARLVRQLMADILQVDRENKQVWGFKEIWNGSSFANYSWTPYDIVFPKALWLAIIRNPFEYARSSADWAQVKFTPEFLLGRLWNWQHIMIKTRERKDTEKYYEVRYEDLCEDCCGVLSPVLSAANQTWHSSCEMALNESVFNSMRASRSNSCSRDQLEAARKCMELLPGFDFLMSQYGYGIESSALASLIVEGEKPPHSEMLYYNIDSYQTRKQLASKHSLAIFRLEESLTLPTAHEIVKKQQKYKDDQRLISSELPPKPITWTPELVRRFWDGVSKTKLTDLSFSRLGGDNFIFSIIHMLKKTDKIIDYGAGDGHLVKLLCQRGFNVAAYEPSESRRRTLLRMLVNERTFAGVKGADCDEEFDFVIATEVIEHVLENDLEQFLARLNSLTKPGGVIAITCPNSEELDRDVTYCPVCNTLFNRWQHVRSFTKDSLPALLATHGFTEIVTHRLDFSDNLLSQYERRPGVDKEPLELPQHLLEIRANRPVKIGGETRLLYLGKKSGNGQKRIRGLKWLELITKNW